MQVSYVSQAELCYIQDLLYTEKFYTSDCQFCNKNWCEVRKNIGWLVIIETILLTLESLRVSLWAMNLIMSNWPHWGLPRARSRGLKVEHGVQPQTPSSRNSARKKCGALDFREIPMNLVIFLNFYNSAALILGVIWTRKHPPHKWSKTAKNIKRVSLRSFCDFVQSNTPLQSIHTLTPEGVSVLRQELYCVCQLKKTSFSILHRYL